MSNSPLHHLFPPGQHTGILTEEQAFPPYRPQRLSAEEIERLATLDPTDPVDRGRIQAIAARSTDADDPARPLVDALLAVPVAPPAPAPYVNPAKVKPGPASARSKRPLTATDIEWIKSLPSDPSKVIAEDAATLAGMVQNAASISDLRFLRTHFEPLWAHHDVAEQQHERRIRRQEAQKRSAARNRHIEHLAVNALATHVQAEFPDLREYEARNRAAEQLRDRWADIDLELQAQIDAHPTWETPAPRPMPGIEGLDNMALGREQAQQAQEGRQAAPGPFDGLRMIGG